MVILEAMSKGMAIVAFDCPTGPREIIEHDHNGLLVPAEDVAAFTAELGRLIEDGERRRRLGEAATTTAKSYDVAAIGGRWDDLLVALGAAATAASPSDGAPVRSRGTTR